MRAKTVRNVLMAGVLSLTLTLVFAVLYVFYPLISVLLSAWWNSSGSGGIGSATGFVSGSFFKILFPIALILFLIIFGLLQRK